MLAAAQLVQIRLFAALGTARHLLGDVIHVAVLLHTGVGQRGVDGGGDVGRQRPWGGRPNEQVFVRAVQQGQADVDAGVLHLPAALVDLHVGDASGAAGAPGHHVVAAIDPAALPAGLEEAPDGVVVLVREGVVGVVPIHPLAEADGLLRDAVGETEHALFALLNEGGDAHRFDVALAGEAELFLGLDLHPEALAVEAVLVALLVAAHGVEALPEIFVGAAPGVMDAHGVVGRHGAVHEGPAPVGVVVAVQVFLEDVALVPPALHALFEQRVVHARGWEDRREELLVGMGQRYGLGRCFRGRLARRLLLRHRYVLYLSPPEDPAL